MSKSFIPRSRGSQIWHLVLEALDRYLTVIALAVLLAGTLLVALGPLRVLLASGENSRGLPAAEDAAAGGAMQLAGAPGAALAAGQLDRELVPYTIIPDRPRNQVITYTVRPGDTLSGIAQAFDVDRTTIFWANSDTLLGDVHMLRPDMDLYILPTDGVYHKSDGNHTLQWIADKYSANVEDIINSPYNNLEGMTPADIPNWGMRIVVPGGQGEFADWRPPIQETVDAATGAVVRSFMPGMNGSCAAGITGAGGTGAWARPLSSYAFTQPYYPGHSGVDLAAPVGTPVTAADTGVVVFSGWVADSWGYGILVVLDHGNGWTTYYGHLSSRGATCGQLVPRGGYVGAVGSTGNSTGAHLHFEMRWNHVPDNPAAYIGF